MSRYVIQEETLTDIADMIREKKFQTNVMTPAQMVEELEELKYGIQVDADESCTIADWTRPEEYPDPTVLDLTDLEVVYLTYDLRKTPGYGWIGLYVVNAVARTTIYFERGHIEGTEFVVEETFTGSSTSTTTGYFFRQELDDENGDIQLWRVRTDGRITRLTFCTNTGTQAENLANSLQPCVERYGRLPNLTSVGNAPNEVRPTYLAWITWWMLRDDVKDVTGLTSMSSAYAQARNLREVHFDGWDTSRVTSFLSCFENCWSLKYIPLEDIVTDSATTLGSMFKNCRCLDNVDIDHFNIDKVTSMASMFEQCRGLKHLEMSALVGTGTLTSMAVMFASCRVLSDIERNIKNLDVTNVTSFGSTFTGCRQLKSIDLSSWNVTKVTTIANIFDYDYALESVNVTGWDVSHITTTSAAFRDCWSLKKIIGFDTWELLSVTNISSMFSGCLSLESFKIKNWDISSLTTANNVFASCRSLVDVELQDWDAPNVITTVASMFSGCYSLKKLHLPNLDFTASAGTAFNSFLTGCYSLEDLDISGWNIEKINAFNGFFDSCWHLKEIDLTSWTVESGEMVEKNTLNSTFASLYNCESIKIHFPLEIVTSGTITSIFITDTPLKYLDIHNWDISKATASYTPNIPTLVDYYPPLLYPVNQSYADARSLTPESLVRILEALPVVTNGRTITLGQVNRLKLTAEELAIATDKGWNVA